MLVRDRAFRPMNSLCEACAIINECYNDLSKSESAVVKKHYLREMEPLLGKKISVNGNGHQMKVGFSSLGNKHLYSDTFGRSSVLTKEDLKTLDVLLAQAVYDGEFGLTHSRNDDIDRFYYFKTSLRGQDIRLNVAQQIRRLSDGRIRVRHFLYSINDI